ncbi:MAG: hypothetical protein LBB41_07380 [Prevotellaceae bacterium]|jgi:hypothetical protein|nr:hypothetical protein [Prevotellaceae bacterium]
MRVTSNKTTLQRFNEIDINLLDKMFKKGDISELSPEYQKYFEMMDLVRGLKKRATFNDELITESKIKKLLRRTYGLTYYEAEMCYADSLNFFYCNTQVSVEAFNNMYADRLDDAANIALDAGDLEKFERLIKLAGTFRGCFKDKVPEIPHQMYRKPIIVYTSEAKDLGIPPSDVVELEKIIDALPDIPELKRERIKTEAGVNKEFNLEEMLIEDINSFIDEEN